MCSSETYQEKLPAGNFRLLGLSDLALYGHREVNSRPNQARRAPKSRKLSARQPLVRPAQSPSLVPFPACARPHYSNSRPAGPSGAGTAASPPAARLLAARLGQIRRAVRARKTPPGSSPGMALRRFTIRLIDRGVSACLPASERSIARKIGLFVMSIRSSHSFAQRLDRRADKTHPARLVSVAGLGPAKLNCEAWRQPAVSHRPDRATPAHPLAARRTAAPLRCAGAPPDANAKRRIARSRVSARRSVAPIAISRSRTSG